MLVQNRPNQKTSFGSVYQLKCLNSKPAYDMTEAFRKCGISAMPIKSGKDSFVVTGKDFEFFNQLNERIFNDLKATTGLYINQAKENLDKLAEHAKNLINNPYRIILDATYDTRSGIFGSEITLHTPSPFIPEAKSELEAVFGHDLYNKKVFFPDAGFVEIKE